uniref:Uncharacterized protein n=1 Tax=Arundo donax TaxID=35708 RepID=A0A0A9DG51_ARUDO
MFQGFPVLKQSSLCFGISTMMLGNIYLGAMAIAHNGLGNKKALRWFHSNSSGYTNERYMVLFVTRNERSQTCRRYHYRSAYIFVKIIIAVPGHFWVISFSG